VALWVLKSEIDADEEQRMLRDGSITLGWPELPELSKYQDREALTAAYRRAYPSVRGARLVRDVTQLHAFAYEMHRGDLVALPLASQTPVAIAEIVGDYGLRSDASPARPHARDVRWLVLRAARADWDEELVAALDSPLTLHRVRRRLAEHKIRELVSLHDRQTDGSRASPFEAQARRAILEHIEREFPGDRLAGLVEAIFEVRGKLVASRQPAEGEEVLAVLPSVGTSGPRLFVGVDTSNRVVDDEAVERFARAIPALEEERGVLVCLRGFSDAARAAAAVHGSRLTMWDGHDLLEAVLSSYENLPDRFHDAIPLKRAWVLASP